MSQGEISLKGVKTHNLKNLDISIPHNQLVVITGVSGSGKSSLAFDTLYAEGQRRYVESLSSYARQFLERMEKPDLDSVSGILPAIAIQAENRISNARSTVGTQTEVNDYLRILFSRIGKTYCPETHQLVQEEEPQYVVEDLFKQYKGHWAIIVFDVPLSEKVRTYPDELMSEMSQQGFTRVLWKSQIVPLEKSILEDECIDKLSIIADRILLEDSKKVRVVESLESAYRFGKEFLSVYVSPNISEKFPSEQKDFLGWECKTYSRLFNCSPYTQEFQKPVPNMFSFNSPLGACETCQGFGRIIDIDWNLVIPNPKKSLGEGVIEPWTKPSAAWEAEQLEKYCKKKKISWDKPFEELSQKQKDIILHEGDKENDFYSVEGFFEYLKKKTYKMHVRIFLSKYRGYFVCPECKGSRLKERVLNVTINKKNVDELCQIPLVHLKKFFHKLKLTEHEEKITGPILLELNKRIKFLNDVGLGYLTLGRLSRNLSGGESQRINLAKSLGSSLVDTLYVLDEPSIGLHERDNELLINLLQELRGLGNTVVVVEHDASMMRMADKVIDMGPFAGAYGGEVIFSGEMKKLLKDPNSLTAKYLNGKEKIERGYVSKPGEEAGCIHIKGASEHNLKNIDVEIPLKQFCVVSGVSGSGKSTLVYDVLYKNYLRAKGKSVADVGACKEVTGFDFVNDIILIDQSPIGRTPRSNPVTYLKAFDHIRQIFSKTPDAQRRHLGPGAFSFNVAGGRCEGCHGEGKICVEMHFMADVYVECDQCNGTRYQTHILEIKYRSKNIHEVLSLTVEEALDFFKEQHKLVRKLRVLKSVGLGYLRLGQSATTLSAGEAQRLKLALEMSDCCKSEVLYIFDEPTTGLHYHDIQFLIKAFDELLQNGNSLLVIEHNMEIIRNADFIIDLGPEGGDEGGDVLYSGPQKNLSKVSESYTAQYLKKSCMKVTSKS